MLATIVFKNEKKYRIKYCDLLRHYLVKHYLKSS